MRLLVLLLLPFFCFAQIPSYYSGIDFTKKIRLLDNYKNTPIILVSSDSMSSNKQEAKDAGASGWITKPFDSDKILAQVRHFIGG